MPASIDKKDIPKNLILAGLNQTANNGVTELTVSDIRVDKLGIPKIFPPPKGMKYICVSIKVRNISGSNLWFVPVEEVILVDKSMTQYKLTGGPTCKAGPAGELQTGEEVSGQLGFTVPLNAGIASFYYLPVRSNLKPIKVSDINL